MLPLWAASGITALVALMGHVGWLGPFGGQLAGVEGYDSLNPAEGEPTATELSGLTVVDDQGGLRRHMMVFVDGQQIPPAVAGPDGVLRPGPEHPLPRSARIEMADALVIQSEQKLMHQAEELVVLAARA